MDISQLNAIIGSAIAFLLANPYIAIVILGIVLLLIDPVLIGFVIIGVILWFAFHLHH
ncbi:MAG TPA: hypothetical protein VNJ52_04925 [Patescibacteria group bacterium]|nr:hypothetical protein [Patescibacteria group bacterium]